MADDLEEEEAELGDANEAQVEADGYTGQPSSRSVAPAAIGNSSSSEEEGVSSSSLKRKHEGGGAAESAPSTPSGKQKRVRKYSEDIIVIDGDEGGESSGAARTADPIPRVTGAFEPPDTAEHQSCIEVIKTLRTEVNTLRRKLEEVRDGIPLCPICLEGVTFPVSLCCGHLFCCACIYRVVMHSANRPQQRATLCPTCRGPISAAPRAPPLAFLQHLSRLRALYSETQGGAANGGGGGEGGESPDSGSSGPREKADPTSYQLQMAELRSIFAPPAYEGAAVAHYDASDDVYRCPRCHWEVVDGICVGCEWTAEQGEAAEEEEQEEGDEEEEELEGEEEGDEEEEEGEEEEEEEEGEQGGGYATRVGAGENFGYDSQAEEEEGEEGEEEEEEEEEAGEEEEDFGGGMLSRGRAGDYGGAYEEEEDGDLGEEADFVEVVDDEYPDDEYAAREEDYGDDYEE